MSEQCCCFDSIHPGDNPRCPVHGAGARPILPDLSQGDLLRRHLKLLAAATRLVAAFDTGEGGVCRSLTATSPEVVALREQVEQ